MMDPRIPVTLLTGFLGAGKTTLLNTVLADSGAGDVAVIVNEFGEAGLDNDLIESARDDVVLMQSGCLCCSVRGELSDTIATLLQRRAMDELSFERIVIETTGLADPGPILQTLRSNPFLAQSTRMDGVVTVADAANGDVTLNTQFEAVSQAAMADLIVISKTDLVPQDRLRAFEDRLRGLNASAQILHAVKGQGVPARFWGCTGLRRDAGPGDILRWTSGADTQASPFLNMSNVGTSLAPASQISPHDSRIVTASVVIDEPISDVVFDNWLDHLIAMRGPKILRAKGILFLEDLPFPFVFHGVQNTFDDPVPLKDWAGEDRRTRVVIIAKDVSQRRLQNDVSRLAARPLEA